MKGCTSCWVQILDGMNDKNLSRYKIFNKKQLFELSRPIYRIYCNIIGNRHVLPNFLIIGAAKGGTTSLYEYLVEHPGILPASGKEVYFFDKNFKMGKNWYRKFFPLKKIQTSISEKLGYNALTGEATPRYIHYPYCSKRVKQVIPSVKIIVMLRNPIDRAYSHYQMHYAGGTEALSFEEAIEEEPKRLEGEYEKMVNDENYYSIKFYKKSYITRGIYADQLERWFKYFPREQFHIIQTEEFSKNTDYEFQRLLKFLDLPEFIPNFEKKFKMRKYPKMKPETREKLVEFFKPHNERLYKLLGTDFGWDR